MLMCISFQSVFSDVNLVAWNWPWWDYFHQGNQQMLYLRAFWFGFGFVSREPAVKHLLPHHCVFWNSRWRTNAILHFYQKYMRVPVSPTASPIVYCQTFEVFQTYGLESFSHCGFDLHFSYYKQTWALFFIYLRIIVYIFFVNCPWFLPIFLTQFWSFVFIYFEEYISLYEGY